MLKRAIFAAIGAAVFAVGLPSQAHDAADNATVLQKHALPEAPGHTGIMLTVNYAPGQSSPAHVHPGSVFAYVMEGEVESQLEGEAPVKYKAGQFWYESPKHPHVVSRNASKTKPAKLLVVLMVGDGEEILQPYKK
ncbi:cupin domain-containing protein [Pseudoduganella sp. RAF53_2]|jgi:quercetin dioxygenase-like cupin family protein|uniref:cupin domain-containing protein n=1 Tax=unclassified Pseudoduganella TaxID=2637179 RepID=UPI003F98AD07